LSDFCAGFDVNNDDDDSTEIRTTAEVQAELEALCSPAGVGCFGHALSLLSTIAANPTSCSICEDRRRRRPPNHI